MFNRYFEAGEDSLEFLFAHLVVKNIDFAKISLRCILDPYPINYELFPDEHTYVFFHIQSVLTACGNLYNVFYGNGSGAYQYHQHGRSVRRTTLLREYIKPYEHQKIDHAQISPDISSLEEHHFRCKIPD